MKEIRYRKAVRLALLVMLSLLLLLFTVACDPADTLSPDSGSDGSANAVTSSAPDVIDPAACEHSFGEWTVTKQGTCQNPGQEVRVCTLCFQREERDLVIPHTYVDGVCSVCHTACEHEFGEFIVTREATCDQDGEKVHVCLNCLYREAEAIPAVGHTFGEWTVLNPGPCTVERTRRRTCSVCGHAESETIPAGQHLYGEWKVQTPASCTAPGLSQRTCETCGAVETQPIPAGQHLYGEWKVQTPASCTAPGLSQRTCETCGAVETQPIPKEPHSYVNGVCSVCGQQEPKGSAGLAYKKNDDNGSYTVTGIGSCTDKDLVIPAEYNGLPVTGIAPLAFMGAPITSATLPASITDYGLTPFLNCTSLTKITLAEGTTALTSCWLLSGTAVKEFVIPESVRTIAGGFFYNSSVTTLRYAGTTSQWAAISKEAHWNEPLSTSTVICTNGSASTKN